MSFRIVKKLVHHRAEPLVGLVALIALMPELGDLQRLDPERQLDRANVLAGCQDPRKNGEVTEPAWRNKQSWYLVATDDRMIPPNAQRFMARRAGAQVVENEGSHSIYVSQPQAVARLVERAAEAVESRRGASVAEA